MWKRKKVDMSKFWRGPGAKPYPTVQTLTKSKTKTLISRTTFSAAKRHNDERSGVRTFLGMLVKDGHTAQKLPASGLTHASFDSRELELSVRIASLNLPP